MNAEPTRYHYRPRPMSAETTLTLLPQHLRAERGGKNFTVPYRDIVAIWLSYKPRGAYLNGFRAKIYGRDHKTITLDDTTFASFFTQQRQARAYRNFVLDLVEKTRMANPQAQIMGGRSFWIQAATLLFGAIFGGILPITGFMALKAGQWMLGLALMAFALAFIGWSWRYIHRNRLRNLRDGIPDDLLPKDDPLPRLEPGP